MGNVMGTIIGKVVGNIMGRVTGNVMSNRMGNVVETCLTMTEKENGQPTKFNENQQESMLALREKVATLLYVGDRPSRPLLHKAHLITICSSSSNPLYAVAVVIYSS